MILRQPLFELLSVTFLILSIFALSFTGMRVADAPATSIATELLSNESTGTTINVSGNMHNSTAVNINLVAAFGFNENGGATAYDNSGNCNNGTLTNAPTWSATGKYGAAILFDGTNDLVNIIDANSLDLTNGMTLEAWIKPSNLTGYKTVLCKENGTNNLAYALSANNSNSPATSQRPNTRIRIGSATPTSTGTTKLALNTWTHIASTYDGTTLRFFINGTQVSSVGVTGNMVTTTNMLRIGGSPALGTQYFAGLIDEVRIYNRALSPTEIQTDMGTPVVMTSPGVVGTLTAVSTFESIGLYWSGTACYGGSNVVCNVQYRVVGDSSWKMGYPLSFDARQHNANDVSGKAAGYNKAWIYTGVTRPANEYRGSIVGLTAGTNYEIKVSLQGNSANNTITQSTWNETYAWPIASIVNVANRTTGLNILAGGTAGNYIKYQPENGVSDTINVNNVSPNCIYINAPYIIISKLTLTGAAEDAIRLGPNAHDVLIDSCDISGWGQVSMGTNSQAGVRIAGFKDNCYGVVKVVIQRCRIHESRANSNSWDNGGHPIGPNGINFEEAGGNHVIRYNEIYGNASHYFMDGIGGGDNFTKSGFTRSDMDIYGNRITMVYDDAIEAEGANMNCRIWNNFLDNTFTGISNATNSVGPMYIFRNVTHVSQRSQNGATTAIIDAEDRGPFNKCGGNNTAAVTGGVTYLFHNTILQPTQTGFTYPRGMGGGPVDNGGAVKNVVSRNNIWQTHRTNASGWPSIGEWQSAANSGNSYDYDLYNGNLVIKATGGRGIHLINGAPSYVGGTPIAPIAINAGPRIEGYYLQSGTTGYDAGMLLPNFNDNYKGVAPDVGAYENGDSLIVTGVNALQSIPNNRSRNITGPDSAKTIITQSDEKGQRDEYNEKNVISTNIHAELFPNPATSATTISFSLSKSQQVSIQVFDMKGRLIKTFVKTKIEAGAHQLVWDLHDEKGRQVNTGIYFLKISLDNSAETKKLSVIHQ
jgi:hypothetical protein